MSEYIDAGILVVLCVWFVMDRFDIYIDDLVDIFDLWPEQWR